MKDENACIGLIGLGHAGMALATPLLRRFDVVGHDLAPERVGEARRAGVQIAASAADLARRCANKLAEGRTTFLVGAAEADYARALPVLEAAAETIFHLGPAGSGMRAKLVNNAVAHTCMVMIVEAAALAAKAGVPMAVFYELMARDSGLTRPLTHRFGERILNQDFDGGMSVANARKDSALVLELARELGVPLFTMQASHTVYEIAQREGLSRLDYAAIAKLWERWIGAGFSRA
ncbi:MAG: NAD-binding protein [Rubrivivax sp.]